MDNTLPSVGPLGVILQPGRSLRAHARGGLRPTPLRVRAAAHGTRCRRTPHRRALAFAPSPGFPQRRTAPSAAPLLPGSHAGEPARPRRAPVPRRGWCLSSAGWPSQAAARAIRPGRTGKISSALATGAHRPITTTAKHPATTSVKTNGLGCRSWPMCFIVVTTLPGSPRDGLAAVRSWHQLSRAACANRMAKVDGRRATSMTAIDRPKWRQYSAACRQSLASLIGRECSCGGAKAAGTP
jgi:hypothetical protein